MVTKVTEDKLKARDNCIFEAGFFSAVIGRERCFLVSSVQQSELPSDLSGIISIPFREPTDLTDRIACAQASSEVSMVLRDIVQREGRSSFHARVPLLSIEELFQRERPYSQGGDLREGEVIVCDTQPRAGVELALQIRNNIDRGINYYYFLHFSDDTFDKIFQAMQVILVAGAGGAGHAMDFNARVDMIKKEKDRILDDLRSICHSHSLRLTLLTEEPQLCFRLHNASNPELARMYARYHKRGFLLWSEGVTAVSVWRAVPKFIDDSEADRIIIPMKYLHLSADETKLFERRLSRALSKYFPGIEEEVKQICIGREF